VGLVDAAGLIEDDRGLGDFAGEVLAFVLFDVDDDVLEFTGGADDVGFIEECRTKVASRVRAAGKPVQL
jgi:hypothetical protein